MVITFVFDPKLFWIKKSFFIEIIILFYTKFKLKSRDVKSLFVAKIVIAIFRSRLLKS